MSSTPQVPEDSEHKLSLRHLCLEDYADVKAMWDNIYQDFHSSFPEKQFRTQLKVFPEGKSVSKTMEKWSPLRFR